MTDVTVEGNDVSGFVNFDAVMVNKLKRLNKEGLCSAAFDVLKGQGKKLSLTVDSVITDKHYEAYDKAKVELTKQSLQNSKYFICSTWSDLTDYTEYLLNPVEAVYVSDVNKIIDSKSNDEKFSAYLALSKICNLVKDVSHTSKANTYTILCGQPLDITLCIDDSVLASNVDVSFLDELLCKDQHKEAMTSLVREALYNLLSDLDSKSRLSHLVTHFNAFISKLLVSYEQYVRNYSFDKVRKEYREKATEYIDKINKVFDDVTAKTFSIPLGVWFAISKMEIADSLSSLQFIKNISYCLMVAFLIIVVSWSLLGQFTTLSATVKEYKGLFERLKSELVSSQEDELNSLEKGLDDRNRVVFIKLIFTIIFAFVLFLATAYVAYKSLIIPS
ncbi:hypothetical protein [Vreelandella populi]|uniref:Uncharacterized protein n=2 Tax=Vreelandella populi TaxID=2498858 RepID=A0A3S0ZBR4_9GAMM|nr:hypothetical protein [Halomonas populi]RUR43263.1 hypothetical protein ELY37_19110 [Halomonas populi]